jgi:23S rRNA (adenine2030-N6)-methyltransferase
LPVIDGRLFFISLYSCILPFVLAYRHQFHAGNFADVFKHALLAQLVLALGKKDKPFFCLDTHAGIAHYDLQHEWTQKNAEYRNGIALLWERSDAPPEMAPYLDAVRAENRDGKLRYYPGSPRIVRRLMRAGDRMVLTELNKKDCASLATQYARDRQVHVECADGYHAMISYLPPKERRGLIFVDSSFDRAREFQRLTQGLAAAHHKFATGTYALWYPLMDADAMRGFDRGMTATGIRRILQTEIALHSENRTLGMRGCGMLVVNPPFGFDVTARTLLKWLWPVLSKEGAGYQKVAWLVPE